MRKVMLIGCAVAMVATGCAGSSDGPIELGAIYPTGGTQGPGGIEEWRGVELAAERVNADGGVNGRPVRIRLERTDVGEQAPGAIEKLASGGVPLVLGSYGSTISKPAAEAATRHDVIFWETGAVGDLGPRAAVGERVFRLPTAGGVLGSEAIAFVRDKIAPRPDLRYAVVYVDDVYGRAVARGALEEAERADLSVVMRESYDLRTFDAEALVARVASAGADVLFVVAYLDDGVAIRRAVVSQQVPLVANIGTSSSYCMRAFGGALGDDAVGVFASDKPNGPVMDPSRLHPEAAALLRWARDTYEERFGEPMTAPALTGFTGAWALLGHVLPAAGALTPDAIATAARRVRLDAGALPNGSGLAFAPPGSPDAGTNTRAASVIWEWVAPGQREVVWPPTFATHDIVAEVA